MSHTPEAFTGVEIAVVGMAGRFPGAPDVDALWRNVRDGVESVAPLGDEDLRARGVSAAALAEPGYVKKGILLEDIDRFDADFFGYLPREAERIDPQQRLFLEAAWQAMEHAGYGGGTGAAMVGVYAGSGPSLYLLQHLLPSMSLRDSDIASLLGLLNGSDLDSLVTRVAYKLDLRGPAVAVQTACSTSLAAVHLACRGLLNHEADMALAGGVWINVLQGSGYHYQPGAILSPDGHCRAFDAKAGGTMIGSGVGVVVLKRLNEAIADGDTIHAVIKGSAMNNDGAAKVGYTAPSVDGQAAVILAAQAMADVSADTIGYVEAHGTGTVLGDPIEIAALTQAFRGGTDRKGHCAIGSVKTNVGHLDAAAGVTGLIKTVMALKHRTLPPSLNFDDPNPQIDFSGSPFYVNTEAKDWPAAPTPRRAGVSSFGMGGTNVHLVLEEAPQASEGVTQQNDAGASGGGMQALMLSARSAAALEAANRELAGYLERHPGPRLADVAHTLRVGRKHFGHRAVALVRNREDAVHALTQRDSLTFFHGEALSDRPTVAFLFPGQGAQHTNMGRALYEREAVFRETVDRCSELLRPHLALDLRELLFPAASDETTAGERLAQTAITQPALFVVEYAFARWWMHQGIRPDAMLGHSIGEYVAACLAGVFSLEDALSIVAARGRLLQATEPGAMLAVSLPETHLQAHPYAGCDLAAVNAADLCVFSGSVEAIEQAERGLASRGVAVRRLHVSHAFHSALVEPMLGEFEALLSRVELSAPQIPFVSNLSGRWITADEACSPAYWVRHVRGTVRFTDGLDELFAKSDRVLLEVGPGETLSTLARRHARAGARPMLASQCHPQRAAYNADQPARCLAQLWAAGAEVEAAPLFRGVSGCRVPLPTYPFERQSYWVEPPKESAGKVAEKPASVGRDIADWFYVPTWKRVQPLVRSADEPVSPRGSMLMIGDQNGLTDRLCQELRAMGRTVVRVQQGHEFAQMGELRYAVRPGERADLERLLHHVEAEVGLPSDVCHLWNVDLGDAPSQPQEVLERSFYSLLALAQVLGAAGGRKVSLTVVANQLEDVTGTEPLCPEKATLHGPCKVMPQEYPHLVCRVVEVLPSDDADVLDRVVQQIVAEIEMPDGESLVAYRGPHRWVRAFEPAHPALRGEDAPVQRLRKNGVYLITGGLGGIGLTFARYLARQWQARLVLIGRNISSDQAKAVAELEALGAEVLALQADVADAVQMRAALDEVRRRFGVLHGVVHAAGLAGGGMIAQRERAAVEQVFAPKVLGTQVLMSQITNEARDFVVFCSSLASLAGGLGKVDYAAANAYLDAVAADAARSPGTPVVSINWDGWREVGMAARTQLPDQFGIGPEQGVLIFERVAAAVSHPQIVVSTTDLSARLDVKGDAILSIVVAEPSQHRPDRSHPRPRISADYVAPAGDLECGLARIWTEVLGIAPLGANDNLFELGGDSLLAIQLLAKVRGTYGVDLHPAVFFRDPTIAALALLIEMRLIEEIENTESTTHRVSETA
ncbi:acyl transferase domain-containing protein/aryl carrier-like protein [Paucibacter oligotrophus]|uniref:Phenolphthiocerol/phthiocerol polyketide synthase subunit E n=1 Tax=Roseateles oligotrophus TaxID=1769250 RepID=A0A840LEU2_9BURK|nr:type I polyketide synthase [Roseateles oligotrophus]MBB4845173.1 acyl transferase domain-containing protein/aryl carrier-like protein [Roseateles oligotrophus]